MAKTTKSKPKKPKASAGTKEKNAEPDSGLFPIVGIGASAGGLEAFEQFLSNVPENSGLAYVIIQHLDPTQKGMLPELLQRVSKMKVYQVKDRMAVKPNCVYVIPSNKTMSILNGVLHLFKPIEARGMRLPVDIFLSSLADDRKELSVGVILSGMGSDGSSGLGAIKENNGIVMVQDPASAKFDSMPRNAINAIQADIIAPAKELPGKLLDFLRQMSPFKADQKLEIKDQSAIDKIIILLRTQTGNDFSLYKKNTLYRRIERRMSIHKIDKITAYVNFLQENQKEVELLFKELLIGVTKIFKFIKSDIGRPFTDQVSDLLYPEMANDALEVLRTLVLVEKQVQGKNGQWYSIRIMPYRTFDDRIDGLVITFINITELKRVEDELDETNQIQRLLFRSTPELVIKLSNDGMILEFNPAAEKLFGIINQDASGLNFINYFISKQMQKKVENTFRKLMESLQNGKFKAQMKAANGEMITLECNINIIQNKLNKATGMILTADTRELKKRL